MQKVNTKEEVITLLDKRYILAAISIATNNAFFVFKNKNKITIYNTNLKYVVTVEMFISVFNEYNYYLIDSKDDITINPDFDVLTLKQ